MSTPPHGSPQWMKRRGQYFGALEKTLAVKFKTSQLIINKIREKVIHRKWDYQQLFTFYSTRADRASKQKPPLKYTFAQVLTAFLRRISKEELDEITHLTKFDWNYPYETVEKEKE